MDIEWDSKKAASNLKKHGVSFDEAAPAEYLLHVALRGDDHIRLIAARPATRKDAKDYAKTVRPLRGVAGSPPVDEATLRRVLREELKAS